ASLKVSRLYQKHALIIAHNPHKAQPLQDTRYHRIAIFTKKFLSLVSSLHHYSKQEKQASNKSGNQSLLLLLFDGIVWSAGRYSSCCSCCCCAVQLKFNLMPACGALDCKIITAIHCIIIATYDCTI